MDQPRRNSGVTESNPQITSNVPQQRYGIQRNVVTQTIGNRKGLGGHDEILLQCEGEKKIQPDQFALHPDPVRPPWAPVLAIRVIASCWVVQVTEVPGLLTRGKAAQTKVELH